VNGSFSRLFFGLWVGLPAGALAFALFAAPALDPLAAVACTALFLVGFGFPAEVERLGEAPARLLFSLTLLQAPFFIAAGRLSAAGWRAAAEVLLLLLWLGIPAALWRRLRPSGFALHYSFFFGLFALGAPFLAYLMRDFGGRSPSWLAEASPFTEAWRLAEGKNFVSGAVWSGGLCLVVLLLARSTRNEVAA